MPPVQGPGVSPTETQLTWLPRSEPWATQGTVHIWAAGPPLPRWGCQVCSYLSLHWSPHPRALISFLATGEEGLPGECVGCCHCVHSVIPDDCEPLHWARQGGGGKETLVCLHGLSRPCPMARAHVPCALRSHKPWGGLASVSLWFHQGEGQRAALPGILRPLLPFSDSSGHQTGELHSYSPVSPKTFLCTPTLLWLP